MTGYTFSYRYKFQVSRTHMLTNIRNLNMVSNTYQKSSVPPPPHQKKNAAQCNSSTSDTLNVFYAGGVERHGKYESLWRCVLMQRWHTHRMSSILVTPSILQRVSCYWISTYKFLNHTCAQHYTAKAKSLDFPAWMRNNRGSAVCSPRVWVFHFSADDFKLNSTYIKFLIKGWQYQTQSTECLEKKSITILATTTIIA